ncbi:hypothetical protein ACRQ5Q_41700 (plasmid) [Bradyrhizobium sp. PMVTL-01]|uniref:hypothetical protein n=1 Tax=Bradyrhizobium sp. PMVTL-01 TaxID=3434999 RepID=UPI003F6E63D3
MDKRFITTVVYSTLGFIGATGVAQAEPAGRYECSIVGAVSQDPIGDKEGHLLRGVQYSCLGVEGPVKGALYTGASTSEWDGPQGTYFTGGGIVRAAGGFAVTLLTEGTGTVIMKDGKPAGVESSGKARYKFASGTLAALSGKAVRWETKPMGVGRFSLELMTDNEPGVIGMSRQ